MAERDSTSIFMQNGLASGQGAQNHPLSVRDQLRIRLELALNSSLIGDKETLNFALSFTKPEPSLLKAYDDRGHALSPIHEASALGSIEILDFLLEEGLSVNMTTSTLMTPLHFACYEGQLEAIEFLLSRGADETLKNSSGLTPFEIASNALERSTGSATNMARKKFIIDQAYRILDIPNSTTKDTAATRFRQLATCARKAVKSTALPGTKSLFISLCMAYDVILHEDELHTIDIWTQKSFEWAEAFFKLERKGIAAITDLVLNAGLIDPRNLEFVGRMDDLLSLGISPIVASSIHKRLCGDSEELEIWLETNGLANLRPKLYEIGVVDMDTLLQADTEKLKNVVTRIGQFRRLLKLVQNEREDLLSVNVSLQSAALQEDSSEIRSISPSSTAFTFTSSSIPVDKQADLDLADYADFTSQRSGRHQLWSPREPDLVDRKKERSTPSAQDYSSDSTYPHKPENIDRRTWRKPTTKDSRSDASDLDSARSTNHISADFDLRESGESNSNARQQQDDERPDTREVQLLRRISELEDHVRKGQLSAEMRRKPSSTLHPQFNLMKQNQGYEEKLDFHSGMDVNDVGVRCNTLGPSDLSLLQNKYTADLSHQLQMERLKRAHGQYRINCLQNELSELSARLGKS